MKYRKEFEAETGMNEPEFKGSFHWIKFTMEMDEYMSHYIKWLEDRNNEKTSCRNCDLLKICGNGKLPTCFPMSCRRWRLVKKGQ